MQLDLTTRYGKGYFNNFLLQFCILSRPALIKDQWNSLNKFCDGKWNKLLIVAEDQELHRRPLHQGPRGEEGLCQQESNKDSVCSHRQRGEMSTHHDLASPVRGATMEMEACFHEDQRPAKRSAGHRRQICVHQTHASECLAAFF